MKTVIIQFLKAIFTIFYHCFMLAFAIVIILFYIGGMLLTLLAAYAIGLLFVAPLIMLMFAGFISPNTEILGIPIFFLYGLVLPLDIFFSDLQTWKSMYGECKEILTVAFEPLEPM